MTQDKTIENSEVTTNVSALTLREKVGQLFQVGFYGTEPNETITELITDYNVGGVIYFSRNIASPDQTANLSESLQELAVSATQVPLLISTDQEGGAVTRVPFGTVPPGAMAVGATGSESHAREFGRVLARQLRAVGINFNLAPVLDVNNNPDNPVIGVRSFGEDPELVSRLGVAMIEGLQSSAVAACGKHFPGHGDTAVDSHHDIPVIDHNRDRLERVELQPFRAAARAGIDAIMSSHIHFPAVEPDPDVPATLSGRILTDLLRDEIGYDGVVVTDCMEMAAIADDVGTVEGAVRAISAGADAVFVSHTAEKQKAAIEAVIDAVATGEIAEERIDTSVRRLLRLKERRVVSETNLSMEAAANQLSTISERIARESVTLIRDSADQIPLANDTRLDLWDFPAERGSPAAEGGTHLGALVNHLSDADTTVRRFTFDEEQRTWPTVEGDVIIVCTRNATRNSQQVDVVERALDKDVPVIVLAMTNPYDAQVLSAAQTVVTTYGDTPQLLRAAGDVLIGRQDPRGTLPVTISSE